MDKIKKIKILSAVSIIGAILAITVAFAIITRSMVINGSGNVNPALWDIHFKDISSPTITGGASVITEPTVADKGAKIDNLEVRLSLPQDKIEYTVYIENSGDMNAKIDEIKYPTLTEEESKIFKFSAKYYSNNSPMQVGDVLKAGQIKKVIITIEYLDISDKNLLPKETKTIDIDFKIKYVQDNTSYTTTTNQTSLLPDGYKECEYIESTGTQYIDTGYHANEKTQIEANLKILRHNNNDINYIFGSYNGNNSYALYFSYSQKKYGVLFGNIDKNTTMSTIYNDNTKISYNKTNLFVNSNSYSINYNSTFTGTNTMYIFWANGTSRLPSITRLYNFIIKENGSVVHNYIPCLDDNDIPCMYDTVSGKTYYNKGQGEFKCKSKESFLPASYTQLDYLESSGTQYIDTGVKLNQNSRVKITYQYLQSTSTARIFGDANSNEGWVLTTANGSITSKIQTLYGNIWKPSSADGESIIPSTDIIEYERDGKNQYVNGNLYYTNSDVTFETPSTAKVFGANYNSLSLSSARVYELAIYEDGTSLTNNFIPALDNNNKPCMYDTVSGNTFYNQGTGEFNYQLK
ncbi:MAG: hypothetical protein IJ094_04175 [Bacilli bacterium]|nr:hypothetical protein [Bacilli bacterium]